MWLNVQPRCYVTATGDLYIEVLNGGKLQPIVDCDETIRSIYK